MSNWWDDLKPDKMLEIRERDALADDLYAIVASKTATETQRYDAYQAWLKLAVAPCFTNIGRKKR